MIMFLNFGPAWSVLRDAFAVIFSSRTYDDSVEHLKYIKSQEAFETHPTVN